MVLRRDFAASASFSSHYPPPHEQSADLSNLPRANVFITYTTHDMSSHPPNKWLILTPEIRAPSVPQQETSNLPQSNVAKSYTARDMSSHPLNNWLRLTPEPQTASAPQHGAKHTHIPLTESRATTASLSTLEAPKQNSEAGDADDAPITKETALQKDTKLITEQMSKLKDLAKRIRRLRGLENSDDEEVTWVLEQLFESAKGTPERMWWMDQLAIAARST